MTRLKFPLSALLLISIAAGGCQSGGDLVEGVTPFTRSELYAYLSEHTQSIGDSGLCYSQEGYFETLIDGKRVNGTWSTKNDGTLCRHVKSLPASCERFDHSVAKVSMVTDSKLSAAPELVPGNTVVEKVMFTPEQTTALGSGKTESWDPNGVTYHYPNGQLGTLWDGVREASTWHGNPEWAVCWDVPSWGPTPCESYYNADDVLRIIYQGQDFLASEHRDGNILYSL